MKEQKLSILQRNKINYILRSGEPLPTSKPSNKIPNHSFPGVDHMRAKTAKRRTLDTIKANGDYVRERYLILSILYFDLCILRSTLAQND